jgi:hypothetical protein
MTYEKLKRGRGEMKSCFPFFLFQISFLFFLFYQMQRWAETNMHWKRRKENGGFGGQRKFKCKWWMKGGKKMGKLPVYLPTRASHL